MLTNTELTLQRKKIDDLIIEAESKFDEDDELRSHLAKYICILCSGFLENAVATVYNDYVYIKQPDPCIASYMNASLSKVQNPRSEKFREIARHFNPAWDQSLLMFMQENERAAAINYIMTDRHKIAHGKSSEITITRIKEHFVKAVEVIAFIEKQIRE